MTAANRSVDFTAKASAFPARQAIHDSIEKSTRLLELEGNWDDDDSPPIQRSTWLLATEFVPNSAVQAWEELRLPIVAPEFLPGPDGSIDIEWSIAGRDAIVRVPLEGTRASVFLGSTPCISLEGTVDVTSADAWRLLVWL